MNKPIRRRPVPQGIAGPKWDPEAKPADWNDPQLQETRRKLHDFMRENGAMPAGPTPLQNAVTESPELPPLDTPKITEEPSHD